MQWFDSIGLAAIITRGITDYLKANVINRFVEQDSPTYDWAVRLLAFIMGIVSNVVIYVLSNGSAASLSGIWAVIGEGLASGGISIGSHHVTSFANARKAVRAAAVTPVSVVTPVVVAPVVTAEGTSSSSLDANLPVQ